MSANQTIGRNTTDIQASSIRIHDWPLKTGITRTPEFEKKRLATHAVNVGTKCGHNCCYCSSGAVLRTHASFRACGESPFARGYAIVDPQTPARVARDAARLRQRGLVQLCTLTDAWAPEAHAHQLGRRCLEAILSQADWTVRILTKNAAVRDDLDVVEKYRDRILVGLSVTAPPEKGETVGFLEPYASSIQDRMLVMAEAAARGLRTYAMFCPVLPSIADSQADLDRLVQYAVDCRAEEIFVEPVNPRGTGLRLCQETLERNGRHVEADAVRQIRRRANWSHYVAELIGKTQRAIRTHAEISKLRLLLYPSGLLPQDRSKIEVDDAGVIWLR